MRRVASSSSPSAFPILAIVLDSNVLGGVSAEDCFFFFVFVMEEYHSPIYQVSSTERAVLGDEVMDSGEIAWSTIASWAAGRDCWIDVCL